jgi:hypothetical protein
MMIRGARKTATGKKGIDRLLITPLQTENGIKKDLGVELWLRSRILA